MKNQDICCWAQMLPRFAGAVSGGYSEGQLRGQLGFLLPSGLRAPSDRPAAEFFEGLFAVDGRRDAHKSRDREIAFTSGRWGHRLIFNEAAGGHLYRWLITDLDGVITPLGVYQHICLNTDGFGKAGQTAWFTKVGVLTEKDRKPQTALEALQDDHNATQGGSGFSEHRATESGAYTWIGSLNGGISVGARWAGGSPTHLRIREIDRARARYDIESDTTPLEYNSYGIADGAVRPRSGGNRVGPAFVDLFHCLMLKSRLRTNWPIAGVNYGDSRISSTTGRAMPTIYENFQFGAIGTYPTTFSETWIFDYRDGALTFTLVTDVNLYEQFVATPLGNIWAHVQGSTVLICIVDTTAWPAITKSPGNRIIVNLAGVAPPTAGTPPAVNGNLYQAIVGDDLGSGLRILYVDVEVALPPFNAGDPATWYTGGTLTFPAQTLDESAEMYGCGFILTDKTLENRAIQTNKPAGKTVLVDNPYVLDSKGRAGIILRATAVNPRAGEGGLDKGFANDFAAGCCMKTMGFKVAEGIPEALKFTCGLTTFRLDLPVPIKNAGMDTQARLTHLGAGASRNLGAPADYASPSVKGDLSKNPPNTGNFQMVGTFAEVQDRMTALATGGWLDTLPIPDAQWRTVV